MSENDLNVNFQVISDEDIKLILDRNLKEWNEKYEIYLKNNKIPKLCGAHFQALDLQRINLRNAIISDCEFVGANLSGSDLSNIKLERTDLSGANLNGANLFHAKMENVSFTGANLNGVNISSAEMEDVLFTGANLNGINFYKTKLERVSLSGSKIIGANLSETTIKKCKITNVNLLNTHLRYAKICESDFYDSDMNATDFTGVKCNNTNFQNANLHGSRFIGAQFSDVNFLGANLTATNLKEARFETVILSNANLLLARLNQTLIINSALIGSNLSNNRILINSKTKYDEKHHENNDDTLELKDIDLKMITANHTRFGEFSSLGKYVVGDEFGNLMESDKAHQNDLAVYEIAENIISKNIDFTEKNLNNFESQRETVIPAKTNLSGSLLSESVFCNIDLSEVILENTDLSNALFLNANLSKTDFTGSNLHRSSFVNVILNSTNFQDTDLSNSQIIHAILNNTNFTNANLSYSKIKLSTCRFDKKCNIIFSGSKLVNAILSADILESADFSNSNMIGYSILDLDMSNKSNKKKYNVTNKRLAKQNVILRPNEETNLIKSLVATLTPFNIIIALATLCLALVRWLLPNPDKRYPDLFNIAIDGSTVMVALIVIVIMLYASYRLCLSLIKYRIN